MIEERALGSEKKKLVHPSPRFKMGVVDAYLKFVLASLGGWGWIEEIDRENLSIQ